MTTATEIADLLPCPFCGGRAFVQDESDQARQRWAAFCGNEEVRCEVNQSGRTEADAIAA